MTYTPKPVLVSSVDTTYGFLNGKLVAGANITLTASGAGNETLTIAGSAAPITREVLQDSNGAILTDENGVILYVEVS